MQRAADDARESDRIVNYDREGENSILQEIPALWTGYDADTGICSWREQTFDNATGGRIDRPFGRSGSVDGNPAFIVGGGTIPDDFGDGVEIWLRYRIYTVTYGDTWEFDWQNQNPNAGCTPCGWLRDRQALIDGDRILKVTFEGNSTPLGRCACFPDQGSNTTPLIAVYDGGANAWVSWFNPQTCCSCGSMAINITGVPIDPITGDLAPIIVAQLVINHGCDGGGQYTYDLVYECCTDGCATFTGYGPKNCNEEMPADGWPCDNTFKVTVCCSPCDVEGVLCSVCKEQCASPYYEVSSTGFTGSCTDYNGNWFLQPDPDVPCLWSTQCGDILITLTMTVVGHKATATIVYSGGNCGTLTYVFTYLAGPQFSCFDNLIIPLLVGYHDGAPNGVTLEAKYCDTCLFCCDYIPTDIVATASDLTGGCASCFPFDSVPMTLQPGTPPADPLWQSDFYNNSCDGQSDIQDYVTLSCGANESGDWTMSTTCGYPESITLVSAQCKTDGQPFEIVFDVVYSMRTAATYCCDDPGGTVRWTFTEP